MRERERERDRDRDRQRQTEAEKERETNRERETERERERERERLSEYECVSLSKDNIRFQPEQPACEVFLLMCSRHCVHAFFSIHP